MSIFDEIKKDLKTGTPGPWSYVDADTYVSDPTDTYVTLGPSDFDPVVIVVNESPEEDCRKSDAEVLTNARRIARLPQLEQIALAAEELVETVGRVTERKVSPATGGRLILEADILGMERALAAYRKAVEGKE